MEWLLLWLGLAVVVGVAANTRGRNGFGWFLLAIVLSPLLAGLLVIALPALHQRAPIVVVTPPPENTDPSKTCPYCAERIKRDAIVCRYCGRDLQPPMLLIEPRQDQGVNSSADRQHPATVAVPTKSRFAEVAGDGAFQYEVVGESHYQDELEAIVGERTKESAEHYCHAAIIPEPDNKYDPNAMAVRISGRIVGYLRKDHAIAFKHALNAGMFAAAGCHAVIVGGWDRGGSDRGHFGVRLDANVPFHLILIKQPERSTATESADPIHNGGIPSKSKGHIRGPIIALFIVGAIVAGGIYFGTPVVQKNEMRVFEAAPEKPSAGVIPSVLNSTVVPLPKARPPMRLQP